MPDWRYNVLSTSEAFIEALQRDQPPESSVPTPRDPLAASYPRRADRTRLPHTCPYTTIFVGSRTHASFDVPLHTDAVETYADAYSVDRSSNLTDTSSFARYEDHRLQSDQSPVDEKLIGSGHSITDGSITIQVQKVPYSTSAFYLSAKTEKSDLEATPEVYLVGEESDELSSCTCDSFERCEFDCRDFEPFSDTCCCDPLENGVCSRSPKDADSPENFCDHTGQDDGVSVRSDMDGLDLTLFEPAAGVSRCNDSSNRCQEDATVAATLCGVLYAMPDVNSGEFSID